jgi:acyl-CoA synthetase (AMP-forming)/AMP-acid ligase II
LEEVLYRHPKIRKAAVIGIPDPAVTEYPRAYVVLNEAEMATAEETMAYINPHVSGYENIREMERKKNGRNFTPPFPVLRRRGPGPEFHLCTSRSR